MLAAQAIATRIREVLIASAGLARTVPVGRFKGGLDSAPGETRARISAIEKPSIEVVLRGAQRSVMSSQIANAWAWELEVEIQITRDLSLAARLVDSDRDAVTAVLLEDADIIAQALTWPGNLTSTSGGSPTRLVSGCLHSPRVLSVGIDGDDQAAAARAMLELRGVALAFPS